MNIFESIRGNAPKKNVFDLSHERKLSMQMGELIPILCEEVVPGDTFRNNSEIFVRLAPMLAPMMHRVDVYTHFFFVPYRLIWDDFRDFITGGEDGLQAPVMPYFVINTTSQTTYLANGKLSDHLGYAPRYTTGAENINVNALPFAAYQTIYNEFYRDQNLEAKVTISKVSGMRALNNNMDLRTRAWEKDYFTTALPWTQRGGEVNLPIGSTAPVLLKTDWGVGQTQELRDSANGNLVNGTTVASNGTGELAYVSQKLLIDPNGSLETDLSSASTTINELRRVTKLQQWLEKNAKGGSRYIEQILVHFGVRSSDARLQRPEYLGGGRSPIVISEVLQTGKTEVGAPQGNMAGHGVSVQNSHQFTKSFEEHGLVIGILSVIPKTAYVQGTRRFYFKQSKFDFYWPEFSQLGEQPVLKGELYTQHEKAKDEATFGYQSRYAEYKFIPSTVHGDFKTSLDFWHMGRKFSSMPALNSSFVVSDPTHRVFAVTTTTVPKLYVQVYNNLKAIRPMPYFNDPSLI